MAKRPIRQEADYREVLEGMFRVFGGVNVERRGNVETIAEELKVSPSVVGKIRTFAERIGGMTIRYEAAEVIPGKGVRGKYSFWCFIHTPEWMMREAKDRWNFTAFDHANIAEKMPKRRLGGDWIVPKASGRPMPVTETPQLAETELEQPQVAEIAEIRRQVAEPEALVEAIRQYMGREEFIAAELVKFHEMGIEIDRDAIKFETNPEMEFAVPLIELIDKLERQNYRLRDRQGDTTNINHYIQKARQLEDDLLTLRHERDEMKRAFEAFKDETRRKAQIRDRRIKELEALVSDEALKRLNGIASGQTAQQV